jgi:hypothetical protein
MIQCVDMAAFCTKLEQVVDPDLPSALVHPGKRSVSTEYAKLRN